MQLRNKTSALQFVTGYTHYRFPGFESVLFSVVVGGYSDSFAVCFDATRPQNTRCDSPDPFYHFQFPLKNVENGPAELA